jgi:hypothetical protein
MDENSTTSVQTFNRRPTWLLNDINEMMLERNGKLLFSDVSSSNHLTRRTPDKANLYKNYLREKSPTYKAGEIYQMKLQRSRIDVTNASKSEQKIGNFVEKLRHERQRQRQHQETYMRHAFEPPIVQPILTGRLTSSRPRSAGAVTQPLPARERPQTAPSSQSPMKESPPRKHHPDKLFKKKSQKRSPAASRTPGRVRQTDQSAAIESSSGTNDLQRTFQERLLTLVVILQFVKKSRCLSQRIQAEQRGKTIFATKIQNAYREMILRNRAYHLAAMPPIFMRFLKHYQKKLAVRKIITFLREYSTVHSHLIVKRFMVCVRQAQVFIREMLRVKRARIYLITLYWEKIEKNYRKQIEDQERETFARQQRERMARINTGASSDVHGRWGMTHKQVVALFSHMDTVEIHRANILRETGSPSRSSRLRNASSLLTATTTVLSDTVDPSYRQRIIEKYVSYKRSLHLKKGTKSPHHSRATSPAGEGSEDSLQPFSDDALNIKLIKRFIHAGNGPSDGLPKIGADDAGVRTNRELLERQLAAAGVAIETDHDPGKKRRTAMRVFRKRPFLCLTDPTLGKAWRQIIEEVVREDIVRKKRLLQEQNRKIFQDRVAEEKKRGIPIPTFTSSSSVAAVGRRGTEASPVLFGMTATNLSAFRGKHEEDALSSSSSPRSNASHSVSVSSLRHGRRAAEAHRISKSSSSPALSRDRLTDQPEGQNHSSIRNKDTFSDARPRLPLL